MNSIKKIIIVGSLLILLILFSIILISIPRTIIDIKGDKYQELPVGEKYKEEGVFAYVKTLLKRKKIDYEIFGKVDTKEPGKYIITYTTRSEYATKKAIRIVNVVDKEKPVITVKSQIKGCKKNNLIEINASAHDNYDGDISSAIKYKVIADKIQLFVEDGFGNRTTKSQKILYIDAEKPKITLNGNNTIFLRQGEVYTELGAIASDSCDGDITKKININSDVDVTKPGTYRVIYKVSDSDGNTIEKIRNIIVLSEENSDDEVQKVANGATIYLTFDDGPGKYTEQILEVLSKYDVKATFFVTNQFPKYQHLISEEYKQGHTIGIHTYSHKWSIYSGIETYLDDFNKINEIVRNQTGIESKIFRFPGGSSNTISKNYHKGIMTSLAKLMTEKGYIYFDWNIDSGDTAKKRNSKEDIIKNIKKGLNGDGEYIILMHDIRKNTLEALPEIIEMAKSFGYEFSALNESTNAPHFNISN